MILKLEHEGLRLVLLFLVSCCITVGDLSGLLFTKFTNIVLLVNLEKDYELQRTVKPWSGICKKRTINHAKQISN